MGVSCEWRVLRTARVCPVLVVRGRADARRAGLRATRPAPGDNRKARRPCNFRFPDAPRSPAARVKTSEAPAPSTTATVNTLNPSVQVQGAYAGSTPGVAKMPFNGKLGLREAIQRGLAYNLGETGATQALRQGEGQSKVARSALLPNINGTVNRKCANYGLARGGFPFQFSGIFNSRRDRPVQLYRFSRASFAEPFSISRRSIIIGPRARSPRPIAIRRRMRAN